MKRLLFCLTALLGTHSAIQAADAAKPVRYEGRIAGVVCSACSASVKEALMSLEGVKEVRITVYQDGSVTRLEITSSSPHTTRDDPTTATCTAPADFQFRRPETVPAK